MKLPNGYGSVYKLSGKRRKPYVARKTIGWTFDEEKGKSFPKYEFIGYYENRKSALEALASYNKDPYDLSGCTFAELYDRWSSEHFPKISQSNIKGVKASYKLCKYIENMQIADIKLSHLQAVVDSSGKNAPTLKKLKGMLGLMWDYAVKHEIIGNEKREIIKYIEIGNDNPNAIDRSPFSREEIRKLWDCVPLGKRYQIPIILIYTGIRIGELFDLKKEDVHLEDKWFFVRKSKTDAGVREVPIADKIIPFFREWMQSDSEYMFPNTEGRRHVDKTFRDSWWTPMMDQLMMSHYPHDCRHTCVSLLTEAGVDERIIKKIVGHKGQGVTQAVYTHIDMESKLEAINKI